MFNNFSSPVFRVDALGTVRDSAGFSTGLRVQYHGFGTPRLLGIDGCDVGLTLRQERVFDRWNQPLAARIQSFDPLDVGACKNLG